MIKKVFDKVMSSDQTGFLKERFIWENIRLEYDLMILYWTKPNTRFINVNRLWKSIELHISKFYLPDPSSIFNFGDSIKDCEKTFYSGIKSCVQNGITSDYLYPQRDSRQWDPISLYLFLLCAKVLGCLIRYNKDIKGKNYRRRKI